MSGTNGDGVESQERGYHLRSGRRMEYRSPVVSRVSETPAHNVEDVNDDLEPTQMQPSQVPLFASGENARQNNSVQPPPASGGHGNQSRAITGPKETNGILYYLGVNDSVITLSF